MSQPEGSSFEAQTSMQIETEYVLSDRYILSRLWMGDAACKGLTELFFAPAGEMPSEKLSRESEALQFCRACHVRTECFEYAVLKGEENGIWGGIAEDNLKKVVSQVKRRQY